MRYPGGKGQAGVYQLIISLMPPHEVYIETHLGGGNILERKKPASCSIGIDADDRVIAAWRKRDLTSTTFYCGDAAAALRVLDWPALTAHGRRVLIYADPPYLATKTRQRYRHKYGIAQHVELLALLEKVPALVMLSGYRNALYDDALKGWYRRDFPVLTRGHTWATESLWLNFDPPAVLHDYRYIGADFRERERIRRQQARWRARLLRLPASQRLAMLELLLDLIPPDTAMLPATSPSPAMTMPAGDRASIVENGAAGSRAGNGEASHLAENSERIRA